MVNKQEAKRRAKIEAAKKEREKLRPANPNYDKVKLEKMRKKREQEMEANKIPEEIANPKQPDSETLVRLRGYKEAIQKRLKEEYAKGGGQSTSAIDTLINSLAHINERILEEQESAAREAQRPVSEDADWLKHLYLLEDMLGVEHKVIALAKEEANLTSPMLEEWLEHKKNNEEILSREIAKNEPSPKEMSKLLNVIKDVDREISKERQRIKETQGQSAPSDEFWSLVISTKKETNKI